mmetsp:Transcript_22111/g.71379  ORF Transcript_22111/g.71379 Transcript_22111/m.71379 type:complete len:610 (-) Transcript_22111:570-2399(-)
MSYDHPRDCPRAPQHKTLSWALSRATLQSTRSHRWLTSNTAPRTGRLRSVAPHPHSSSPPRLGRPDRLNVGEGREGAAAQPVELLAEQLDLLCLHLDERVQLGLHVHLLEAVGLVVDRALAPGLDGMDHLALVDRPLQLLDLPAERVHLGLLVGDQLGHLALLPPQVGQAVRVCCLHLLQLALELLRLLGLRLLGAAADDLLQVLGYPEELEVARLLDQVFRLHLHPLGVPQQLDDAAPKVTDLLEQAYLVAAQPLDVGVELTNLCRRYEHRPRVVGHHRRLLHLDLALLHLEGQLHVARVVERRGAVFNQRAAGGVVLSARLLLGSRQRLQQGHHLAQRGRGAPELLLRLHLGGAGLNKPVPHLGWALLGRVGPGIERGGRGQGRRVDRLAKRVARRPGHPGRRWLGRRPPAVEPEQGIDQLGLLLRLALVLPLQPLVVGRERLARPLRRANLAAEGVQAGGRRIPPRARSRLPRPERGRPPVVHLAPQPGLRPPDDEQFGLVPRLLVGHPGVGERGQLCVEARAHGGHVFLDLAQLHPQAAGPLLALRCERLDALLIRLGHGPLLLGPLVVGPVEAVGPRDVVEDLLLLRFDLEHAVHHGHQPALGD